jgi:hypothetical protein
MTNGARQHRSFWIGVVLLLLVGVFLGIRAGRAVHAVLGDGETSVEPVAAAVGTAAAFDGVKDSLLAVAVMHERDPFRDPPPLRAEGVVNRAAPPPVAKAPPDLRALLYDNVNPSVQLSQGTTTSGWLHRGDSFLGWTVLEITPTSTTIARGGESVVLTSS